MNLERLLREAGQAALDFDCRTEALFKPYAGTSAVKVLHPMSKAGDQPQLRFLCASLVLSGILVGSHRLARAGSRMIIAHEAATFAKDMIKTEIDRTRPRAAERSADKKPRKGNHTSKEMTSFPSGHTAGSVAAARAFAREFPEHASAAVGLALAISFLQIVRCAHYPSDVAAGVAIGLTAEKAADLAVQSAGIAKSHEGEEQSSSDCGADHRGNDIARPRALLNDGDLG